jgi:hypothetical protein
MAISRFGPLVLLLHHVSRDRASLFSTCSCILVFWLDWIPGLFLPSSSIDSDIPMDPPASSSSGEAGPSQAGLGKRKRSLSNMNPGSRALQAKKARKAFTKRPKKPKKPSDWHMRKGEVPKEAEKTKVHIHCIQAL